MNDEEKDMKDLFERRWQEAGKRASKPLPSDQEKGMWEQVLGAIEPEKTRVRRLPVTWLAAASIGLLVVIAGWWFWPERVNNNRELVVVQEHAQPELHLLPDGTQVWLSNGSALTYQDPFAEDLREVQLEGEAYFDVAHDADKPFTVRTGSVETRVLGTSFNLKAVPGDTTISLALVEGSVEMRFEEHGDTTVRVKPGEHVSYRLKDKQLAKSSFAGRDLYEWKEGILRFDRASVEVVARRLERWYNIRVDVQDSQDIEGTLVYRFDTRKLSLEDVARGISTVMDYNMEKTAADRWVIRPKAD